jgi:hypothetical protein
VSKGVVSDAAVSHIVEGKHPSAASINAHPHRCFTGNVCTPQASGHPDPLTSERISFAHLHQRPEAIGRWALEFQQAASLSWASADSVDPRLVLRRMTPGETPPGWNFLSAIRRAVAHVGLL